MVHRAVFFLLLSFVIAAQLTAQRNPQWAKPVEAKATGNLYQIDAGVYRCAQPDAASFAELEKMGVKEALNLRYWHSDDGPAAGTGITLHRVKMMAGNCDWDKVVEALRIINDRKGPIIIHCKHGSDRTGLVSAMYRIIFQGWSKDAAIDELENGGYDFHTIYANIPTFIRNVDVEAVKKKLAN